MHEITEVILLKLSSTLTLDFTLELVSKELNNFAAILHACAGGLNFMR